MTQSESYSLMPAIMDNETIYIDVVTNFLQLVGDQEMSLSIQQLNGIQKLKSDFTIVL